ncbi:hypothetical protein ABZ915_11620 [Streptomyces sp. NPDC046915]|uniref:hypothetical protein n=1 Tax=Streptomyces sp. NPDC046915 TaxID=3155257 RepID=UPI0033F07D58
MGVFARLLRRSKATDEASATEPLTGAESGGPETEESPEEATASATAASTVSSQSGATEIGPTAAEAASSDGGETGRAAAAEATEIPKQQSAEEAADNEAGDGART